MKKAIRWCDINYRDIIDAREWYKHCMKIYSVSKE